MMAALRLTRETAVSLASSQWPSIAKINRAPGRAFYRKHTDIFETGMADLPYQILWRVKVSGYEAGWMVCRISMLASRKIGCDDVPEGRLFEISF
jgi:hypothetical protein